MGGYGYRMMGGGFPSAPTVDPIGMAGVNAATGTV